MCVADLETLTRYPKNEPLVAAAGRLGPARPELPHAVILKEDGSGSS